MKAGVRQRTVAVSTLQWAGGNFDPGAIDPAAIVRVYVTTPRTPKDRLQILRTAFAKTLTDPEFIAEAKKATLDINPLAGEDVKKIVDDLFKLSPAVKTKLASMLAAK